MDMAAPARLAFARSEASRHKMLITQPPILQFDWWHAWDTESAQSVALTQVFTCPETAMDGPMASL